MTGPVPVVPSQSVLNRGGPNMAFAAATDDSRNRDYALSPVVAWAVGLRSAPGATPDPMREQAYPVRDYRPDPHYHPQSFWTGPRGSETENYQRYGVEFQDADGIEAPAPITWRMAPDPNTTPPAEPRWTNRLSPHNYVFTRPFGQDTERYFTGAHFSMADHRRTYPILGMAPSPYRRNTYRADPTPWDTDRIDMPNPVQSATPGRIVAFDIPPSGAQSWRL